MIFLNEDYDHHHLHDDDDQHSDIDDDLQVGHKMPKRGQKLTSQLKDDDFIVEHLTSEVGCKMLPRFFPFQLALGFLICNSQQSEWLGFISLVKTNHHVSSTSVNCKKCSPS